MPPLFFFVQRFTPSGGTPFAGQRFFQFHDQEHGEADDKGDHPVAERQPGGAEQHLHKRRVDNQQLQQQQYAADDPDPFVGQQTLG